MSDLKKRVVFSMGGKGGVGKTTFMLSLLDWYKSKDIAVQVADLDWENKKRGALLGYFPEDTVKKVDISLPGGLDIFLNIVESDFDVMVADMGAGSGKIASQWFNEMYPVLADKVQFTAVGVVTDDPASVTSVQDWVTALNGAGHRADILIVENHTNDYSQLEAWNRAKDALVAKYHPEIITMAYRIPNVQAASEENHLTLGKLANGEVPAGTAGPALKLRAITYRDKLNTQLEAKAAFLG